MSKHHIYLMSCCLSHITYVHVGCRTSVCFCFSFLRVAKFYLSVLSVLASVRDVGLVKNGLFSFTVEFNALVLVRLTAKYLLLLYLYTVTELKVVCEQI